MNFIFCLNLHFFCKQKQQQQTYKDMEARAKKPTLSWNLKLSLLSRRLK